MLFTGAIIWASLKLVSFINHNTACTKLIQWNIPLGAKCHRVCLFAPGSGQNGLFPYFSIFAISQWYEYICLHFMIEWCINIVSRFLPYIMIISWIFSTWDRFFLSYAILPRLPLHDSPVHNSTVLDLYLKQGNWLRIFAKSFNVDVYRTTFGILCRFALMSVDQLSHIVSCRSIKEPLKFTNSYGRVLLLT